MTTLVVGATGATGRLLVEQLLKRGEGVRAVVRSPEKLPPALARDPGLTVIQACILDCTDAEMAQHVAGCRAVASCLGHNLTLKGIFGPPHRLVTDAARRLCQAVKANAPGTPVKFVLMSTVANRNRDLDEPMTLAERLVIGLLRRILPPQADNEQAADYLRTQIGHDHDTLAWAAVRPDTLIDRDDVTAYELFPSPTSSGVFGDRKTRRINVADFMARLITEDETWARWQGHMPVIYDTLSPA